MPGTDSQSDGHEGLLLGHSDDGMFRTLRQQCGGLPTMAALSR